MRFFSATKALENKGLVLSKLFYISVQSYKNLAFFSIPDKAKKHYYMAKNKPLFIKAPLVAPM